eukprot:1159699-Pelagomonas_calceolata.AAC.7
MNFCISPEKHWLGHTDIGPCMYGTMKRLWGQMRDEGLITKVCGPYTRIAADGMLRGLRCAGPSSHVLMT